MADLNWLNSEPIDNAWLDRVTDYMNRNPNDQAFYEQALNRGVTGMFPSSSGVPFTDPSGRQVTLHDTWTPTDDYDFSGFETDTGVTPSSGGSPRGPVFMNSPGGGYGGGYGSAGMSINLPRYDPNERKEWIEELRSTQPAQYGDLPTLDYPEFEAPAIDKNRLRFLTQQNMAPAQALRGEVNRMRLNANASGSPDAMRKILEGYSSGMASLYGGATKAAQGQYGYEHGTQMNEALTNFQARVDQAGKNWAAAVQQIRDEFGADRYREDQARSILARWYNI